jgi:hypothetical protein
MTGDDQTHQTASVPVPRLYTVGLGYPGQREPGLGSVTQDHGRHRYCLDPEMSVPVTRRMFPATAVLHSDCCYLDVSRLFIASD